MRRRRRGARTRRKDCTDRVREGCDQSALPRGLGNVNEPPSATLRRRHVAVLLEVLVFGVLSLSAVGRLPRSTPAPPAAATTAPPPLAVDLESDPPARLELLPGIGPTRAAAIVRERIRNGPFGTAEALVRVHGIGPDTVRRIRTAREVRPVFGDR